MVPCDALQAEGSRDGRCKESWRSQQLAGMTCMKRTWPALRVGVSTAAKVSSVQERLRGPRKVQKSGDEIKEETEKGKLHGGNRRERWVAVLQSGDHRGDSST